MNNENIEKESVPEVKKEMPTWLENRRKKKR